MPKALVAFAGQSGQTEKIANFIAVGLRESGVETVVISAAEIRTQADLEGYDVYVFGSATYHTKMMPGMRRFRLERRSSRTNIRRDEPVEDEFSGAAQA
jgi:menaquinone-dependent protoporphyrinogen IX oxidase